MKIAEMKMGRQLDDQRRTGESDLNGTIGQADAGTLHGGSYTLSSGFLAGMSLPLTMNYQVYLPLILR